MKKIKVVVEKTRTGYSAFTEDFPVFTTGGTMDELKNNMLEAVNLHKDYHQQSSVTLDDLSFQMDLSSFFDLYPVINAAALSRKVGMNKTLLSQYVSGKKKPSEQQLQKIMDGIREVGKELSQVHF